MRAIVCTKYGSPDDLQLKEVKKASPKNDEILIKVHATTVTSGDCRVRSFKSPPLLWVPMRLVLGFSKPRKAILGVELAGEIEAVGKDVKRFKKGDQVYGLTGMRFGAHAEYTCMPEAGNVALKPANVSYEEATTIPFSGTTALHYLKKGKIQHGQKVLIYGASGAVGSSAVQLAKYFGADVTGVCSIANLVLVKSLGADRVIDYRNEDFISVGDQYDLIFDAVGKITKSYCKKALAPNGKFISVAQGITKVCKEDLIFLKEIVESGDLKPVIDRRYPLEQIADAHRYVDMGRKRGNVVITVTHGNDN
ncbi:NAD(P)-dependent alcohol dehydrogenase [Paenibacillus sp. GSMTC-2017]|uniref:NAD(P)-dependent alcohol dehydrogenase n=1 Tax=Paenibacillus sp. GSMTC-2017 TaxID=2794350 RepID=UPI0018DA17A2|nr:NAD(P)-dependent alcohol dehydrogenase [Paenibacillus sp. GSMTC-2017]MBH5318424.1 NAD(P)-dependent alcohol dehydrogenase [Paenibacillus sp. GSMTC-2017]